MVKYVMVAFIDIKKEGKGKNEEYSGKKQEESMLR